MRPTLEELRRILDPKVEEAIGVVGVGAAGKAQAAKRAAVGLGIGAAIRKALGLGARRAAVRAGEAAVVAGVGVGAYALLADRAEEWVMDGGWIFILLAIALFLIVTER